MISPSVSISFNPYVPVEFIVFHVLSRIRAGDIILIKYSPQYLHHQMELLQMITLLVLGLKDKGLNIWGLSPLIK